jgi:hypothetical protein
MRTKLLAAVLLGAAALVALFAERRTRPELADEYGD